MEYFYSCDWGTTHLRLRLVKLDGWEVIAEESAELGIAKVCQEWRQRGGPREAFYADILRERLNALAQKSGVSWRGKNVVISGMASSSIGMKELPYGKVPFPLDGSGLETYFDGEFLIISGVSGDNDVMRGEETKAVGCAAWLPATTEDAYLLMPGTHPKHVVVNGGRVTGFRTFMTGEVFGLMSAQSILSASVSGGGALSSGACATRFAEGVAAGARGNLLHELFMVRTSQLLKGLDGEQNWFYLSGLMIGAELAALPAGVPVWLVSGPAHAELYSLACKTLGITIAGTIDADEALVRGQSAVLLSSVGQPFI